MRRTLRRHISDSLSRVTTRRAGGPRCFATPTETSKEQHVQEYLERVVAIHKSEINPTQLLQQLEQELAEAREQRQQCDEQYQQACDSVDRTVGAGSELLRIAEIELETAKGNRMRLESELGRPCQIQVGRWNYVVCLAAVAYVQAGLAQTSLLYAVNDPGWSWFAAGLFGVAVTGESHIAGEKLRSSVPGDVRQSRLSWRYFIGALFETFVVLLMLCAAVFLPHIVRFLMDSGYLHGWSTDYPSPHEAQTVLALCLVFVAGGVALSFLAHDANLDLARWFRVEATARRRLNMLHARITDRKAELLIEYDRVVRQWNVVVDVVSEQVLALGRLAESDRVKGIAIELAVDYWRFRRTFSRVLRGVEEDQRNRFRDQFDRFGQKVESTIRQFGLRIVDLEGQQYDQGMAASPLNLDEFDPDESLAVDKMLEPTIVGANGLENAGTITLRRLQQ